MAADNHDFGEKEIELFLRGGLELGGAIEGMGEISRLARTISIEREGRRRSAIGT